MSVTSKMMEACGEAEGRLASELMQHEVQIERDVLDPLNQLTEVKKKDSVDLQFWGQRLAWTSLSSLTDRDSKHYEAKKTARQVGSGLRLGQDEVSRAAFSQRNAAEFCASRYGSNAASPGGTRQPSPPTRRWQPKWIPSKTRWKRLSTKWRYARWVWSPARKSSSGRRHGSPGALSGPKGQSCAIWHGPPPQEPDLCSPPRRTSSPQTCTALPRKREITHATTSR